MSAPDWFEAVRQGNAWHGPAEFRERTARRGPHARPRVRVLAFVRRLARFLTRA